MVGPRALRGLRRPVAVALFETATAQRL